MHILMLLTNAFRPDPRVEREASALLELGHRVTLICWDRRGELSAHERHNGFEIIRVHSVPSTYGSGWRQLFYTPRFWRQAIRLALQISPQAVHCHDLDTLYAGWQLKKRLGCPLVYDAHEHFPALMSIYLPGFLVRALVTWERFLLRQVDYTITASTVLRDEFLRLGFSPVITLANYPDLDQYISVPASDVKSLRSSLGVSPQQLLVAYIGGFSLNRQLLPLIEAADLLPEVQFHLWGDGHQKQRLQEAAVKRPNVIYHGWLSPAGLPLHFKAADVIYYCLRDDYPGAVYNAPNTLSQAMAAGRPIIANQVGDLGRIIKAANCGLLIDQPTSETIAAAITKLKNPQLRQRLGSNGVRFAQTTYNTASIQDALGQLYREFSEDKYNS